MGLLYNKYYLKSNDLGVIIFRIWVVLYVCFAFINFRGPRDFINRRGLLIQGGDYIYIYIYIYDARERRERARREHRRTTRTRSKRASDLRLGKG